MSHTHAHAKTNENEWLKYLYHSINLHKSVQSINASVNDRECSEMDLDLPRGFTLYNVFIVTFGLKYFDASQGTTECAMNSREL